MPTEDPFENSENVPLVITKAVLNYKCVPFSVRNGVLEYLAGAVSGKLFGEWPEWFQILDQDLDGKIEPEEFRKVFAKKLAPEVLETLVAEVKERGPVTYNGTVF